MSDAPKPRTSVERIRTVADIPPYKSILTAAEAMFEIPPKQREKCIAIALETGRSWIIADEQFAKANPQTLSALRAKLHGSAHPPDKTVYADSHIIESLYQTTTKVAKKTTDDMSLPPEGKLFDEFMRYGLANRASDVHFEIRGQHGQVRYRIDNEVEPMRNNVNGIYTMEQLRDAIGFAYNMLQSDKTGSHASFSPESRQSCMIPYMIDGKVCNLRYQSSNAHGGFDVVIRYLTSGVKATNFEQLGYSEDQIKMLDLAARTRTGMILIVGVTGSGKSTTLRTVVGNIPGKELLKIFTIEDPVEDVLPGVTQISVQRSLSDTSKSPMKELEGVLVRMDPDSIMVGEIRDGESGSTAQVFLETGHQVMATLHAASALGAFPRLLSEAIGFDMSTITSKQFWSLIIYQALVPVLCNHCKIPASEVMQPVLDTVTLKFGIETDKMCIKNPDGCEHCGYRGTTGRTVIAEMIYPNRKILSMIRDGKDFEAELEWRGTSDKRADSPNMTGKTVFEHALYKASIGMIDIRKVEEIESFERYENIWES